MSRALGRKHTMVTRMALHLDSNMNTLVAWERKVGAYTACSLGLGSQYIGMEWNGERLPSKGSRQCQCGIELPRRSFPNLYHNSKAQDTDVAPSYCKRRRATSCTPRWEEVMSMHPSPCLVQKQYHTSNSFLKSRISPSKHYEDCVLGRRLATSAASHRFWDFEAPDVLQSWLLPRPDLMFRLGWRTKSQQRIPNLTDLSDTSGW